MLGQHSWCLRSVSIATHRVVLDLKQIEPLLAEKPIEETLHPRFSELQSTQWASAMEPAKRVSEASLP